MGDLCGYDSLPLRRGVEKLQRGKKIIRWAACSVGRGTGKVGGGEYDGPGESFCAPSRWTRCRAEKGIGQGHRDNGEESGVSLLKIVFHRNHRSGL